MADYVVQYSVATGYVWGMWLRTTSDNISTAIADGDLTIDGVEVISGAWPDVTTDIAFVLITDPTAVLLTRQMGVMEVTGGATDVEERTDGGKNPDYEYS